MAHQDDRKTNGSSEQDLDIDLYKSPFSKPSVCNLINPLKKPNSVINHLVSPNKTLNEPKGKPWTIKEDGLLKAAAQLYSFKNWKAVSKLVPGRTHSQCSQRWRRIQPYKMRQPWSKEEDKKLIELVTQYGQNWSLISSIIEGRTGKQVRERWLNRLNPLIDRSRFTKAEDQKIIQLFKANGAKWKEISNELKGRTENMVKNRFYSFIKKNLLINQPELYKELFEGIIKEQDNQSDKQHSKSDINELIKELPVITPFTTPKKLEISEIDRSPVPFKEEFVMDNNTQDVIIEKKHDINEPFERLSFLSKKKEVLEGLLIQVMGQIQEHHFSKKPDEMSNFI